MKIGLLYVIFAAIATISNLATQEISYQLYTESFRLAVSIFFGTLVGLIVKYILDKKYIFKYQTAAEESDFKVFLLYSCMGLATTVIFWVTEFAFDYWFETKFMRYVGAVIGLSVGYIVKYSLDKKYVFVER